MQWGMQSVMLRCCRGTCLAVQTTDDYLPGLLREGWVDLKLLYMKHRQAFSLCFFLPWFSGLRCLLTATLLLLTACACRACKDPGLHVDPA